MAVITPSSKETETESQQTENKKIQKSLDKCRPITATLEYPLILDIKLLQKLDMTTFTRKGLIELAKFCGISLITKSSSRIKLSKCMKAIKGPKKFLEKDSCRGVIRQQGVDSNKSERKFKRKLIKSKILRFKPRINLKIVDLQTSSESKGGGGEKGGQEEVEEEEDSSDVVCRKHEKSTDSSQGLKQKHKPLKESTSGCKRTVAGNSTNPVIEVIPEPCKSCNRTRQPERLHSHPRTSVKTIESDRKMKAAEKKVSDERLKGAHSTKNAADSRNAKKSLEKCNLKERTSCAKASPQKCHLSVSDYQKDIHKDSLRGSLKIRGNSGSSSNSVSSLEFSDSSERKSSADVRINKKSSLASPVRTSSRNEISKMADVKKNDNDKNGDGKSALQTPDGDALKYVTGCYICGSQVSPKARMQHEKECILEWRNQNSQLPAEDRKAEPIRPDYRFTASGELDCEGTFESIWANHKDSLVPCKTCGRKFFPDRIERHQNCCNSLSLRIKYKH